MFNQSIFKFCGAFLPLAALLFIVSCKKDSHEALPKIKSLNISKGSRTSKTEFFYGDEGNVSQIRHSVNGVLKNTMYYQYENGILRSAVHYSPDREGAGEIVADFTFKYDGQNRMNEIAIQYKGSWTNLAPAGYTFTYGAGEIPLDFSVRPEKIDMLDPALRNYLLERWFPDNGIPVPNFEFPPPDYTYEYDAHKNPLYHIPVVLPRENLPPFSPYYGYEFDPQVFFGEHNMVGQTATLQGRVLYKNKVTFEYDANGLPLKSIRTNDAGIERTEITYTYY